MASPKGMKQPNVSAAALKRQKASDKEADSKLDEKKEKRIKK